jgi:hypothetical protein
MASESNEVEVIEENDAWFYLDVDEISSNDHGNEEDCIVWIHFIQTMNIFASVRPENSDHSVLTYGIHISSMHRLNRQTEHKT